MDELIRDAFAAREGLLAALHAEGTDCYRLFHGAYEGVPGLTIDRYGALGLIQTFRAPLEEAERDALLACLGALDGLSDVHHWVYNHRGKPKASSFADWHQPAPEALETMTCSELGVTYLNRARHRGQDPMFYLDFRVVRRFLQAEAAGRSVLNLYAYTGTAGICAAVAGASEVWNVDFSASALAFGKEQAALHTLPKGTIQWYQDDVFPIIRQLSGLPLKGRARRKVDYIKVASRQFDFVVLDPPTWSKGHWGAVDIVRDYQGMSKPALLTVAEGGALIATNHAAAVDRSQWVQGLERCASKAGRPFRSIDVIEPEADFPCANDDPLLKIAVCRV